MAYLDITITTQTNLSFVTGQYIQVIHNSGNYMYAQVVSYNSSTGSLTFLPISIIGTGTYSSWTIICSASPGTSGTSGSSGTSGATGSSGTSGTSGVTGSSGTSGTSGATGTSGASGTSGTSGTSGSSGSSGFASTSARAVQTYTSTAGQTTFTVTNGYNLGMVDVFLNGIKLVNGVDYTATNGTTVVLATALTVNQIVEIDNYLTAFLPTNALRVVTNFTATAGQTTFTVTYTPGLIDVYYNGSCLAQSEYTATNGTSVVLGIACQVNDIVVVYAYSYAVGAYSGIGGSGTTNYIPKFTSGGTIGNSSLQQVGSGWMELGDSSVNTGELDIIGNSGSKVFLYDGYGSATFQTYYNDALTILTQVGGQTTNLINYDYPTKALTFQTNGNNERLRITSTGNVGIGTSSPSYKLQVSGGGTYLIGGTSDSSGYTMIVQNSGFNNEFLVRNDGLVSFPSTAASWTTGNAANAWINPSGGDLYRSTSSIKYKKNVHNYTKGLAEVMQLRPVSYEGKGDIDSGKTFAGLIAEEVHELGLTEFVQYAEDGTPDALAYQNMIALAFKAIQELKAEIEELKNK